MSTPRRPSKMLPRQPSNSTPRARKNPVKKTVIKVHTLKVWVQPVVALQDLATGAMTEYVGNGKWVSSAEWETYPTQGYKADLRDFEVKYNEDINKSLKEVVKEEEENG